MDEIKKKDIQDEIPWCMLFAYDILLVDETKECVNTKLELWRQTLEAWRFEFSKSKIEYMEYTFSKRKNKDQEVITFDGQNSRVL